jgi:hypothetical protein
MKSHQTLNRSTGILLAACFVFVFLTSPAISQESQDKTTAQNKMKSEKKAMTLSLVGTLASLAIFLPKGFSEGHGDVSAGQALALVGFFAIPVGPSLGYFYAGATGRGLAGAGIRLLGLAALAGGVSVNWNDGSETLAYGLAIGGVAVTIGSTILDLSRLKKVVQRRNARAGGKSLVIAPIVSPKSKTLGLQIQLAF